MLRQDREIADSLVVMAICIGLPAAGAGYARNVLEPIAQVAQAGDALPAWMDPETTGAITPKADSTSAHVKPSQPEADAGSTAWVDPPRRSTADDRTAATIDEAMELRLPRL